MSKVTETSKVTVHYVGKLNDGNEFDNSYSRNTPLTFEIGKSQVIPGFESAVLNREINEKFDIKIPKDQAYGEYSDENIQKISKKQFSIPGEVKVGQQLQAQTPDGRAFLCILKEITDNDVLLDMNHPLAGQDLNFSIEILKVEGDA